MSILIKGIDIAQFRTILAWARTGANNAMLGNGIEEIIEVPTPYGRLIDADKLKDILELEWGKDAVLWDEDGEVGIPMVDALEFAFRKMPTVIEREE